MTRRHSREVPPEIVIEPPNRYRDSWFWAICQPDAAWAEIRSGYALSREDAVRQAQRALADEDTRRKMEMRREARRRRNRFPGLS